jgi:hypothetical protein
MLVDGAMLVTGMKLATNFKTYQNLIYKGNCSFSLLLCLNFLFVINERSGLRWVGSFFLLLRKNRTPWITNRKSQNI